MKQMLTVKQVAQTIGLSEYTIRTGVSQGRIPYIRTSGNKGKILIDIDLFQRKLEEEAINNASAENKALTSNYGHIRPVSSNGGIL